MGQSSDVLSSLGDRYGEHSWGAAAWGLVIVGYLTWNGPPSSIADRDWQVSFSGCQFVRESITGPMVVSTIVMLVSAVGIGAYLLQ